MGLFGSDSRPEDFTRKIACLKDSSNRYDLHEHLFIF
jgi:hypothetical protein